MTTLVLGAGGPIGQAFHAGVLHALAEEWDPRRAQLIVGTSAGAQVGALLRAGLSAHDLYARIVGEPISAEGQAIVRHLRPPAPPKSGGRWPGSAAYLRSVLRRPWLARPGRLAAALLPEGNSDADHLHGFSRLLPHWPKSPLWIPAVDFDSGQRVVFGRPGAPLVDVGTAVRCSSAVPAIRRPVRLGSDRFIDGGIASPTHLDLAAGSRLVVVSSPLSRFAPLRWLLRHELRQLRGARVILFEPDDETVAAMGWNLLNPRRARDVARAAWRCARATLAMERLVDRAEDGLGVAIGA
jgi:NTE family protein